MNSRPPVELAWGGIAVTLSGLMLCAAGIAAIPEMREAIGHAVSGDTARMRAELEGLGVTGALVVLGLALAHVVVFYPAEIVDAAAGFAFGFWVALPLVHLGWMLNALVAYHLGHTAARPLLYRLLGEHRFRWAEDLVHAGGATTLLALRLVPIFPFSLISYVCGAARVPLGRFAWTTAVGYLPLTALFVYLGSRLEELSLTDPILIGGFALLVALLLTARWIGPFAPARDRA